LPISNVSSFGLKNFDMVFVFKDFTRTPYHVNTIPVEFLDQVKDFLDSSDIASAKAGSTSTGRPS